MTYKCENDRYCWDGAEFESVEAFEDFCRECFGEGEVPELRPGRDAEGTPVYWDEHDEIAVYEVE